MKLKAIQTEQEYDEILAWMDKQFDRKLPPDSSEGKILQAALLLVKAYEDKNYPVFAPNPIEAV